MMLIIGGPNGARVKLKKKGWKSEHSQKNFMLSGGRGGSTGLGVL